MYKPEHVAAWKRVVDFVHSQSDAKIAIQLAHAGRKASCMFAWEGGGPLPAERAWEIIAPSAIPFSADSQTPREMNRADMDRLMASEFKEELPALLTRAIIATAVKTGASYGINEATRGESEGEQAANAIARIAAGLYLASQNRADTRSWATLPKCYQYARVQAPSAGEILLSTPDGQSAFIDVQPDSDTIVFVRSLRPGVRLQVRSVVFGSGGASGRHDALDARGRTNPSETEPDRTERNSNDERIDVYTEAKTR